MKTRILFLIDSLKFGGGAERVVSSLSFNLPKNYELFLLTVIHIKKRYPFQGEHYSLREENRKRLNFFIRPIKIFKHFKKVKPDIIISFSEITNIFLIITKLIFRLEIPIIISVQCNPLVRYKKEQKFINLLIKHFYPLQIVNGIVVNSKGVETILKKHYKIPEKKITTINNAINFEEINSLKRELISNNDNISLLNTNLIKFVNLSRFRKIKGHINLIRAFSKVKSQISHTKLFLIGDGDLKPIIKQKISELGLDKDVILLGIKKNPFKFMDKMDIFVLSSKAEGFGIALIEAMACGLPIISTNCQSGPREILKHGKYGLLAEVNNINDLAEKMKLLAEDGVLRKKFTKLAQKRVKDYQWKNQKGKWIKLIKQKINSSKRKG